MDNELFLDICRLEVVGHFNYYLRAENLVDYRKIGVEDVFIVWSCKTLQNNKALLSTRVNDGRYYEITYNGDKDECYIDVYKKEDNIKIEKMKERGF